MRANLGTPQLGCSFTSTVSPEALAGFFYESTNGTANINVLPTTNSSLTDAQLSDCGNDDLSLTTAFCVQKVGTTPSVSQQIDMVFGSNGTSFVWNMNNSSYRGDYNNPVLEQAATGNLTFEPEFNVFNFGTNKTIRIVLYNHFTVGAHPMHLHGHNFHVLAEGTGTFNGTLVNAANSQVRDVQVLRAAPDDNTPAYIVIEWVNDNPGMWPFHCHIAWHVSAGLYVNILEQPGVLANTTFPSSIAANSASWDKWTSSNVVDQIDSGV
jgi:FtsP/CotA-like multicopper oxidase with cupredoxin domain